MVALTLQLITDYVNLLPEEYRTLIFYREIVVGWETLILKTADYSLICYHNEEGVKWVKSYAWKTRDYDEVIYEQKKEV